MTWREFHEATKHSRDSIARGRRGLDWANMPDPFRHYEGVPVLDLPADPPGPEIPMLEVLQGAPGATTTGSGPDFLSKLLFYSAAISAAKRAPGTGYKYALRVNPSSGNLHPTEFHFVTRGLTNWPDGLYHYRPSSHMAEQRAAGRFEMPVPGAPAPIVFVLTSIAWREAWKYGNRAYRYCLHDIGHAWQALALTARAMGCESFASGRFPDNAIAQLCRLNEDEWPMLMLALRCQSIPVREPDRGETIWFGGNANRLSPEEVDYPLIRGIHEATKCDGSAAALPAPAIERCKTKAPPASSSRSFADAVRTRRSALDFQGGAMSMSLTQLLSILDVATRPLAADFAGTRFVHLHVYAHRVQGLEPGLYRYWADRGELELIRSGDQRVIAAGLSLGQDLAGNACAAFSMIADFEEAVRRHGDRAYRYVHFEAGAIGHRMYLAAEALGLQATGIGAFFDEEVNRNLGLEAQEQVVYHFAIGYAIPDTRLEA